MSALVDGIRWLVLTRPDCTYRPCRSASKNCKSKRALEMLPSYLINYKIKYFFLSSVLRMLGSLTPIVLLYHILWHRREDDKRSMRVLRGHPKRLRQYH